MLRSIRAWALVPGLLAPPAPAADPIRVLERHDIAFAQVPGFKPTHELALTLAYFADAWTPDSISAALRDAAPILAQCGVRIARAELARLDAPAHHRAFDTQISRMLARVLALPKPTIYFVADSRQQPAFDAEAIGRGNSATRPELRDTVWVARGARDLDIVLAHELAHLLMDSGEHSDAPGNLMREYTSPENTRLSAEQCTRLRDTGTSHGLLQPVP